MAGTKGSNWLSETCGGLIYTSFPLQGRRKMWTQNLSPARIFKNGAGKFINMCFILNKKFELMICHRS